MTGDFPTDGPKEEACEESMECQILRTVSRSVCVIRLLATGAVLQVEMSEPMNPAQTFMICALKPVNATIKLGYWKSGMIRGCSVLSADWPGRQGFPPPCRFLRKKPVLGSARRLHNPPAGEPDYKRHRSQ
jgi:hypothetical protein